MKIDKMFLKEFILKSKDNAYILELYKIYDLCSNATNNDIRKGKPLLDALEDKIYTINGKKLNQKERIILELKRLFNGFKACDNKELKDKLSSELQALIILFENTELDDKDKVYELIKKKIAVIEAKLYLPISFLYGASSSFLDIYESAFINNKTFINSYDLDKDKNIYNKNYNNLDYNKFYNNKKEVK